MATYYCYPGLGSGDDDGSSEANAWSTLQRAIDGTDGTQPGAGDVVLCRGTDTLSATVDFDGTAGSGAGGFVIYRGVNSSWVNDGTRFIVDANNGSYHCIKLTSDYIKIENFDIGNTSEESNQNCVDIGSYAGCDYLVLINCDIHNGDFGVYIGSSGSAGMTLIKCKIRDNADHGFRYGSGGFGFNFHMCSVYNNGGAGLSVGGANASFNIFGCLIRDNTLNGIQTASDSQPINIMNTVIHGNSDGIECKSPYFNGIGLRITSNTVGIDSDGLANLVGVYMPDTGEDLANTTKTTGNYDEVLIAGVNTNNLSGTDTDGGYEGSSTDDYNLTDTATLRRLGIDLDV